MTLTTTATCAPLTVANGKPSIDSAGSVGKSVNVLCNEGYVKVGTYGICKKLSPDKAEWVNVPACEG